MISIINYGLGNISAFANIYRSLGIQHCIASTPDDLLTCHLILPGVGSFDWAMQKLDASGMRPSDDLVLSKRIPVLGIGLDADDGKFDEEEILQAGWISGHVNGSILLFFHLEQLSPWAGTTFLLTQINYLILCLTKFLFLAFLSF